MQFLIIQLLGLQAQTQLQVKEKERGNSYFFVVKVTIQKPPQIKKRGLFGQPPDTNTQPPPKKPKTTSLPPPPPKPTPPPSVGIYFERAFRQCKNDEETAKMEKKLRKIYAEADANGTMMTIDWDARPLPR